MMKTIKTLLMITLILSLFSCANDISDNTENPSASTPSDDGKTYIVVDLESSYNSRTILPATSNTYKNKLTNITLKGKISGSDDNPVTLAHSDTYAAFSGRIPIAAGNWDFTITAEIDGIPFKAEKNQTITSGTLNYLGFTLQADSSVTYGGLKITTNFTGDANKVVVKLLDQDKQSISTIPDQEIDAFESSGSNYSFTYERPITDDTKRLTYGTYYIIFSFYKVDDNNTSIVAPLNTYRSYVRIAKGVTTTATITIDLDEVYTITYNYWYNETSGFTADELEGLTFSGGTVLPEFYSRRSENFTLPTPSITGYTFDHWELNGQTITQITKGTTGDLEIDAFFTSQGGGGGTPNPDNTNMVMMNGTRSYLLSGDYETSTLGDYYNIINNMYVGKQEITQAEFEKYMIYYGTAVGKGLITGIESTSAEKNYRPDSSDNKSTTPAYYISYPDALVYCNLRSKAEGLTPVYSMKISENTFSSEPDDWIGVVEVGKMTDTEDENKTKFYTYTTYDNDSDWHPKEDYGRFKSDLKATGYRLPTLTEWKYIASQDVVLGLSDGDINVSEWTTFYNYNGNSDFANYPQSINTKEALTPDYNYAYSHDIENIGFRVVRYVSDTPGYEYEDFELPSGLLWATCNVGADNPYDYGDYFAWGELSPRYGPEEWKYSDNYRWQSYFDGSSGSNFTTYKASGTTELQSDNDTATKNMGDGWSMPTKTQLEELINNTFITATNDYKATGISGVIVYKPQNENDKGKNDIYSGDSGYVDSPEGTYDPDTDTHIFFPANGHRNGETAATTGWDVCIWTRTLNTYDDTEAYFWAPAHKDQWDTIDDEPRYYGMGVRGVKQP